jgi:hypothetical protein
MMSIRYRTALALCAGSFLFCFSAMGQDHPSERDQLNRAVRAMGLQARLQPEKRDQIIVEAAGMIEALARDDEKSLQATQEAFQNALLLVCDREIYETLKPETIEAVDQALETIISTDDFNRDYKWESLFYVYGFFNRNVSVAEIIVARDAIKAMPDKDRQEIYPIYPHTIDALTKTLAMGPLSDASTTAEALKVAVPLLKEMVMAEAQPGLAFHPPSHAILVIAPIYERWVDSQGPEGAVVRELLGTRSEFVAMLESRLVGSVATPHDLPEFHYGFYAYVGQFFANAFARMDARETVEALKRSRDIYMKHGARPSTIAYTNRALASLGDSDARAELEESLSGPRAAQAVETRAWMCRNLKGEGKTYGQKTLALHMSCEPEEALGAYLAKELEALEP